MAGAAYFPSSPSCARRVDEGINDGRRRCNATEQTPDAGWWALARRIRVSLDGTHWQTVDGMLLVELPAHVHGALRAIPGATQDPSPRSTALAPNVPPLLVQWSSPAPFPPSEPAARSASSPDCRPAFESEELTPVVPMAAAPSAAFYELSPEDLIPLEESNPEIPITVEDPLDLRDTARPVILQPVTTGANAPKSWRVPLVAVATAFVTCALVGLLGWRGGWALFPGGLPFAGARQPVAALKPQATAARPTAAEQPTGAPAPETSTRTANEPNLAVPVERPLSPRCRAPTGTWMQRCR
jgi:hypothetical protein